MDESAQSVALDTMARVVKEWLEADEREKVREGITVDGNAYVGWSVMTFRRSQLQRWFETLEAARDAARAA